MNRIMTGLFVATSLVAVSACNKTENADNMATANMMTENVDVMADNMVANDVMAGNDANAMAPMDANTAATENAVDPNGSNGGH